LFLITGLLKFSRLKVRWRPALDAIGAVLILIAWLTWGTHNYQGRIFIMALAHIVFFSLGAWYAWHVKPRAFGSRFLTVAVLLGVTVAAWRVLTLSVTVDQSSEIFDRNLIQQVYLGAFSLGVLGLSIGFVLLANERLREELEFLATRDPMTGAFNRRAFFARAEVEWARAMRSKRALSVIGSDIDFFKKVNDTYGHHIGDEVIKDFSRRASAMLRVPDILARFGGEEFFILLPDTGLNEARQAAERIRREIETRRNDKLPPYTVSLGIAETTWGNGSPADLDALLSKADAGLYKAKHGGRNRVEAG
jgi:diguanylate cyclase (GGDEF)-like protein